MKTVEVRDQVRLGLGKCIELVLSGVRFRLFRATITVTIIALAVAFLMTMLSESLIARDVSGAIDEQTGPRRRLLFWVGRLSGPLSEAQLARELADLPPARSGADDPRRAELRAWGKLSAAQVDMLAGVSRRERVYADFFADMHEANLNSLVGRARGADIFRHIIEKGASAKADRIDAELREKIGRQLPAAPAGSDKTALEAFKAFLRDFEAAGAFRSAILDGNRSRLAAVRAGVLKGRRAIEVLAGADEKLREQLAGFDFHMPAPDLPVVREQASLGRDALRLEGALSLPVLRKRLAKEQGIKKVSDANRTVLLKQARSEKGAKWLLDEIAGRRRKLAEVRAAIARGEKVKDENKTVLIARDWLDSFGDDPMTVAQVRAAASSRLAEGHLARLSAGLAADTQSEGSGFMGFSTRTMWLMVVSLMVCLVGITNAMLMSVTERFQEIATMKCLGATDGFIMVNFILESTIQGLAGGVVGTLLGFLLGTGRSLARFGLVAIQHFPAIEMLVVAGSALLVGVVVSAMAAVYPAWVAARLAPMEAMRIE